ncbi:hypothetical protein BDZ89DRAFT_1070734 [Hymenopellis radicata]|nr:hypothetical protein BDZ89DRAFT_1070734 [Hymenopellis radicata]
MQDSGITVFAVVEVSDSDCWHSSDETRDVTRTLYSTLKSANRAAIRRAREAMANDEYGGFDEEEDLGFSGHWDHSEPFRAEKQFTKYETWSVEVERETLKVYGPNLALGEVDSDSSDEEGDSDEEEDADDDDEQEQESPEKVHAETNPTVESTARQKRSPSVLVISDSEQVEDSPNKKQKV